MPKVHRCLVQVGSTRQDNVPYVPGTSRFKFRDGFRDGSKEGNLKDVCLSPWPIRIWTNPVYVILLIVPIQNREKSAITLTMDRTVLLDIFRKNKRNIWKFKIFDPAVNTSRNNVEVGICIEMISESMFFRRNSLPFVINPNVTFI